MIRPVALLLVMGLAAEGAEPRVSFTRDDGWVRISIDDEPLGTYVYRDETITRPYLAHVRGPGGARLTRNHPPESGDARDHAELHPGVWLSFGDLNGRDYWRLKTRVAHDGFAEEPRGGEGRGTFAVRNRYLGDDGETTVATETCRLTILTRPAGWLVLWDSAFTPESETLAFGDQEEMGLGVRLATPLVVANRKGGRILDADGHRDEKEIRGQTAAWCDYAGRVDGTPAGVTLMPDPRNFRRSWWHVRDYGLMAANPFGRNALTGGEPSRVTVGPGESLRLRFGVLLHAGRELSAEDLDAAHEDFTALLERDGGAAP